MTTLVTALVDRIAAEATRRDLYLYRYQTSQGRYVRSVTYALHSSEVRPARGNLCDSGSVVLSQLEGCTDRCEAYRELNSFLRGLVDLPVAA